MPDRQRVKMQHTMKDCWCKKVELTISFVYI